MGFLGGVFGKSKAGEAGSDLEAKAQAHPNDPRLWHQLAAEQKTRGDLSRAQASAMRAAEAHVHHGFEQRAVAELQAASKWAPPAPELLRRLADLHLKLQHREDARDVLLQLKTAFAERGDTKARDAVMAEVDALGPGR